MGWEGLGTRLGRMLQYRKAPIGPEVLAEILAERHAKQERASELQFLIACARDNASSDLGRFQNLEELHAWQLELIDTLARLTEIDAEPLHQEVEDIFPQRTDCFEKMHLLRLCKQLREESLRDEHKAIEADVAWRGLLAHIRSHGC